MHIVLDSSINPSSFEMETYSAAFSGPGLVGTGPRRSPRWFMHFVSVLSKHEGFYTIDECI